MTNLIDNKYIPLPDCFEQKGYTLTKIHDFRNGWLIYKREKKGLPCEFELIYPTKQEKFEIHGNVIEPKIKYPSDNNFGKTGFSCISLERAKQKYIEIQNKKEERGNEIKIELPKIEFTIKDIESQNPNLSYIDISNYIKNLVNRGKLKIVGEKKNPRGKSSKIYKIIVEKII